MKGSRECIQCRVYRVVFDSILAFQEFTLLLGKIKHADRKYCQEMVGINEELIFFLNLLKLCFKKVTLTHAVPGISLVRIFSILSGAIIYLSAKNLRLLAFLLNIFTEDV